MTRWRGIGCGAGLMALSVLAMPAAAAAQAKGPANALQGFSQNKGQPIKIDASTLEVRDKQKIATFTGNVQVVQGDTTLRSKVLVVFYEQTEPGAPAASKSEPQRIRRLEAKGNVIVTQREQIATGDNGIYDMPSNSVTLTGNVVVTQGQNIIKGDRLVVDLETGVSRVEAGGATTGRVQGLFLPSSRPSSAPDAAQRDASKDAGKEAPKSKTMHPGLY